MPHTATFWLQLVESEYLAKVRQPESLACYRNPIYHADTVRHKTLHEPTNIVLSTKYVRQL